MKISLMISVVMFFFSFAHAEPDSACEFTIKCTTGTATCSIRGGEGISATCGNDQVNFYTCENQFKNGVQTAAICCNASGVATLYVDTATAEAKCASKGTPVK
jgi:hypothetical protein